MKLLSLIVVCLFILITFVQAAGSSETTGSSSPSSSDSGTPSADKTDEDEYAINAGATCDTKITLQQRIKCRLENNEVESNYHESCIGAQDPAFCESLYDRSAVCYEKSGREKDKCFKEMSGFDPKNIDQKAARVYVVLLLYNLQEIVEEKYKAEELTSTKAAALISQIVQFKKSLLGKTKGSEIKHVMGLFKTQWGEDVA